MKRAVSFALALVFLLGFSSLTGAQQFTASVQRYGPENGLAHREVNAIFQDRRNFMWFGTKFGLNRFDGATFTTYTRKRNGLDFDDIQSIAQDADGLLWLMGAYTGSKAQITLFNPVTGTAVSFEENFKKHPLTSPPSTQQRVFGSPDGTIFFANYQPATLVSYHPKSGLHYVPLPHYNKLALHHVTGRNTVWAIADDNQLVELAADGRALHAFHHDQATIAVLAGQRHAGTEFFYAVYRSSADLQGIQYRVDERGNRRQLPASLGQQRSAFSSPIYYAFDRLGLIWTGTQLRSATKGTLLDLKNQLAGQTIDNRCFFADRNGGMWLGTSFGVYQVRLAQNYFHRLFYEPTNVQEKAAAVRGITVVADKVYASLEKKGLYSANRSDGSATKRLLSGLSYGLTYHAPGELRVNQESLITYDLRSGTHTESQMTVGTSIWTEYRFSNRHYLAGGILGLWLVEARTGKVLPFTRYNQFSELARSHVVYIGADRQGTNWICSTTGLYTVDSSGGVTARYWSGGKGRFRLPTDNYQHFYQDPKELFWLATANSGLVQWDRRQNSYRQFSRTEGLSNDNIYAVYADPRGHLWLSSDYGIMQFDPVRMTTRSYFVQDGITHNEFNRIAHFQDQQGRLYLGGLNGITAFDPRDFAHEKPPITLPLHIVSFRQFDNTLNKLVDKTEELLKSNQIVIRPGDRTSVLDFALLNYADAPKNVYAYLFKGLDNEWTYQTEPSLRLSNLPYGEYQLLIKGQAADGQLSAANLAIQVVVLRPFYLRDWFLLLMLVVFVGAVWGWGQWRDQQHRRAQIRLQTQINEATRIIARQAQDLLQLDETKSRFFANISHEFRTPLTVILGIADNLRQQVNPQLRQSAVLIERNGRNLLRLINQILDLSRLEASQMPLKLVRTDLIRFVRFVGESFQLIAGAKRIHLTVHAAEEVCEADFNPDKLQDIVANLLGNALKFTPPEGEVRCEVAIQTRWQPLTPAGYQEALTPTRHLDDPWIQITVSDTGPGIDPASLTNIFNRFYQAGPHQDRSANGGTGIGLSLVRELVSLLQGGLAVRNRLSPPGPGVKEPGLGSITTGAEFVVRLPLTRKAPLADDVLHTPILFTPDLGEMGGGVEFGLEVASDRPMLLLVEDSNDVATYIQTCLREEYQIIHAENGQIGIDQALAIIPDLIVSDVMMPAKDGFELCDALKNDERTSHIPIVLLTARAAVNDRLSGLRRGSDAYLVKPFEREELLLVLRNLLQTRQRLQHYYSQRALGNSQPGPVSTDGADAREDEFVVKLRSILEFHLDNVALDTPMICQLMGMSRTALYRKMMALTGMSVIPYLRALRLQKAEVLLTTSALSVAEVAYAVGFDNPRYFSRVFSEEKGIPPSSFRDIE